MSSFQARLGVPGQTRLPLEVELDIGDGEVVVTVSGKTVADWRLADLVIVPVGDGYRITADNEELIVTVSDKARFVEELGLGERSEEKPPRLARWWAARTTAQPTV